MPDPQGHDLPESVLECIEHCRDCQRACVQTLTYCLQQGGHHAAADHVRLMTDCAEICQTTGNFMLRGSELHVHTCAACAEVSERCAEDCERFTDDLRMQACAETGQTRDSLIIALSPDGQEQWRRGIDGQAGHDDGFYDVVVDDAGRIYVAGFEELEPDSRTAVVRAFTPDGGDLWRFAEAPLLGLYTSVEDLNAARVAFIRSPALAEIVRDYLKRMAP